MQPYSQDLRRRVIAAIKTGKQNQGEIAETFGVHLSTVEKWWRRWRETRTCAALAQRHGPRRALRDCATFLRTEIKRQPDVTLPELCARVAEVKGVSASPSMMCRELRYLRLPRKKVTARQPTRHPARETLTASIS
ncbi:MAG TPA: helix-turn-helix domain-containing protein [Bradyrhizobium sp.]